MTSSPQQHISLADGRALGYDDVGDPKGVPILYFHGVPSSRADWRMWGSEALLHRLGVRLIAVDRPGVGASDFQPGRSLSDWPADVVAFADALGLERFGVLGYSGGGPYAAACACLIPDRLLSVGLVSSVAPFDLPGMTAGITPNNLRFLKLAREHPWLYRLIYRQLSLLARYVPGLYLKRALATFDAADRGAFARPDVHGGFFAAHGTPRGQQVDTALIIGAWDFDLGAITVPVHLWYGDQDRNVSAAMFRYLAAAIPNAHPHLIPGEGHISLIVEHAWEILRTLVRE